MDICFCNFQRTFYLYIYVIISILNRVITQTQNLYQNLNIWRNEKIKNPASTLFWSLQDMIKWSIVLINVNKKGGVKLTNKETKLRIEAIFCSKYNFCETLLWCFINIFYINISLQMYIYFFNWMQLSDIFFLRMWCI